jgi:hypothetical protein
MIYTKLVSLLCLIALGHIVDSEVCPGEDSCQHNYGRRLQNKYQARATFVAFTQVPPQSNTYDPIPCCTQCNRNKDCDYYYLEFANGNCTLFSLPDDNTFVTALVGGQLYDKVKYEGCCVGYPNVYIFKNMPEVDI